MEHRHLLSFVDISIPVIEMGISRRVVLSIAVIAIAIASVISSISVYSYPATRIDSKIVDVYEIVVPVNGFEIYRVAGDGRNIYLFGRMENNATIIKYDASTNNVVKIYSVAIPYVFWGYTYYGFFVDGVYANGYVYALTDNATLYIFDSNLNLITKMTQNDLGFTPDSGLRVLSNNVVVYGSYGLAILNGSSVVMSKSIDAYIDNVVYDGEYYVLNIENTTDSTYRLVALDKNLNIVKVSSPMDIDVHLGVWSNGYVVFFASRTIERTIGLLDKDFNIVKIYNISEMFNVVDYYIAYLDVVDNVIVAVGYSERSNYNWRFVMIIDIDTDKAYSYITYSYTPYPYLYTNYGFYDPVNNALLYPSIYSISNIDYPALIVATINKAISSTVTTIVVPTTITYTTTIVSPVLVYQTETVTVTTAVGMAIETNIIIVIAMVILLAIGLVYALRRSR